MAPNNLQDNGNILPNDAVAIPTTNEMGEEHGRGEKTATEKKAALSSTLWGQMLARARVENIPTPPTPQPQQPEPQKQAPVSFPLQPPTIPAPPAQAAPMEKTAQTAPETSRPPEDLRVVPGMPGFAPATADGPDVTAPSVSSPPKDQSLLTRIRTYKSDVASLMRTNKTSLSGIALAEQKKRTEQEEQGQEKRQDVGRPSSGSSVMPTAPAPAKKRRTIPLLLGIILFFTGAGAIAFLFFFFPKPQQPIINNIAVSPLIFSDNTREIDLSRANRQTIIAAMTEEVKKIKLQLGSTEHLYLTEGAGEEKKLVTLERFFEILRARPPATLVRSLKPGFMFGGHVFNGNQPFLIFKTTFFENAFASMLVWENDIEFDLGPLFIPEKDLRLVPLPQTSTLASTTRATSTPRFAPAPSLPSRERTFEDAVLQNKDARVLRNEEGKIVFLYAFPDRETLVITTNENTFKEIVFRMTTLRFVR